MSNLQYKLFADKSQAILIILQGMDTSGKDGTVRHVMNAFNPQSCKVVSFKTPNEEEILHDYLWRIHKVIPAKGKIGIFNRSHYEDVLIVKVNKWITEDICAKSTIKSMNLRNICLRMILKSLNYSCILAKMNKRQGLRKGSEILPNSGSSQKVM